MNVISARLDGGALIRGLMTGLFSGCLREPLTSRRDVVVAAAVSLTGGDRVCPVLFGESARCVGWFRSG